MYTSTSTAMPPVAMNATCAPNAYHTNPVNELASNAHRLWNPAKKPIAVAPSDWSTTLTIHAF
jgi:hypothetical protein